MEKAYEPKPMVPPFSPIVRCSNERPTSDVDMADKSPVGMDVKSSVVNDIFADEPVEEVFDVVMECCLGLVETMQKAQRMHEGYWDDEDAKRYFISKHIDSALLDLKIAGRNLRDIRRGLLGPSGRDVDQKKYHNKDYVHADFYMDDEDGMTHHAIYQSVVAHKRDMPKITGTLSEV